MSTRLPRYLAWLLPVLLGGCYTPVREQVDLVVCDLAAHPLDVRPLPPSAAAPAKPSAAAAGEPAKEPNLLQRLRYPNELPGGQAPPLEAIPSKEGPEREAALSRLYPPMPDLGPNPEAQPGADGRPYTLTDLQRIALSSSPAIRQATFAVESAKGAAQQAGFYPNPNFGYEGDVMGTGGSAGLHGAWFEQIVKTAGKLKLAQAVAVMDLLNAELALRATQMDVAAQVRAGYYGVLVARKSLQVNFVLAHFMDELYRIQVGQVRAGTAAPYEPVQLSGLAWITRGALIQARNRYVAAWNQLAAAMGVPALPLTQLAGEADMPVPVYEYDRVLKRVLQMHTDVRTAQNSLIQARYSLRLAEVTPYPDLDMRIMVQKDNTTIPHEIAPSIVLGVPIPLWNRNQGNIHQARGNLGQAIEQPHLTRNNLTGRVAEAFQRYQTNRALLAVYINQVIPRQVQAYRGTYQRHYSEGGGIIGPPAVANAAVGFADVIVAQQQLATSIATYLMALGDLWTSVVDLAHLLQTDDMFAPDTPTAAVGHCPVLDQLLALPCCHPCSPLPDPALRGANGAWPAVTPAIPATLTGPAEKKAPAPKKEENPPPAPPPAPAQGVPQEEPLIPDYPEGGSQARSRTFRKLPWQQ
jgi:cobalt-zinc-cadmium efflux system outer membrane protein